LAPQSKMSVLMAWFMNEAVVVKSRQTFAISGLWSARKLTARSTMMVMAMAI